MSDAKTINLTIDGRPAQAQAGQTVLDAAASIGVRIPSLCHHRHLPPLGACRLCLVEIDQQRALQPACTFPAAEGLVVRTDSPKVQAARLLTLQLLFSERGHYCMICPMSGGSDSSDCELQQLGYQCGMASWSYPPDTSQRWAIDASHPDLVLDHSRCVLCRRCVRACETIAANHTLGVQQRGTRSRICADDDVPLGESSCISCGVCVQVCPTGALTDRRSAFAGHESQIQRIQSACQGCAVGCGIVAAVRDNQLLRIDGDFEADNGGLLCAAGRYEALRAPGDRIVRPLIRGPGGLRPASWEEALRYVVDHLTNVRVAGLASPTLPTESLAAFTCLFHEALLSDEVGLTSGQAPPVDLGRPGVLGDTAQSDCLIVIGGDPLNEQRVLGYLAKRAFDHGARIIVVDDAATGLDRYATEHLHLEEISSHGVSPFARLRNTYHLRLGGLKRLKAAVEAAQRPVVLYGPGLSATDYAGLRGLPAKVRFLPLVRGSNTLGAAKLGLAARPVEGDVLYALLGEERPGDAPPTFGFRVVQAAWGSAWTESADVVLPARIGFEQGGHLTNLEGQLREIRPLLAAPTSVRGDGEVLLGLALRMGCDVALDQIPGLPLVEGKPSTWWVD